jgi:hypothetical protein
MPDTAKTQKDARSDSSLMWFVLGAIFLLLIIVLSASLMMPGATGARFAEAGPSGYSVALE